MALEGRGETQCTKIVALNVAKCFHSAMNLCNLYLSLLHCETEIMPPSHRAGRIDRLSGIIWVKFPERHLPLSSPA